MKAWFLLALFALVIANNGCSTPPVPDTQPEPAQFAWWAYQECLESLAPYQDASACDSVDSPRTHSRANYTRAGKAQADDGQFAAESEAAFRAYLEQADADSLKEMTDRWLELAKEAHGG